MKGIKRYLTSGNSVPAVTDIEADSVSYGQSALVLACTATNSPGGDDTSSGLYLVRCGSSGDHVFSTPIAESTGLGNQPTLTVSISDGHLALVGFRRYLVLKCKM